MWRHTGRRSGSRNLGGNNRVTFPPSWIEITRASIILLFREFDIFSDAFSITISYPKILIPFLSRVGCSPSQKREKKTSTPTSYSACCNCLALAMWALYRYRSDLIRSVRPKCPLPFYKIIFPRTDHLYPTYKHGNQTPDRFGLVCATGMYRSAWQVNFPKFQTGIFVEWRARKEFSEKSWPG